jgi:S1-C subfamily serine protease
MVRDLSDTDTGGNLSTSLANESPSSTISAGTTPAVSGNGAEPIADVAAALSPAVVQIQREDGGLGSGTIYDAQGYILTNAHVVGNASTVRVVLADGSTYTGEVLGTAPTSDVAVVDIDADIDLPVARLATEPVRVGQTVVAIGSPFGLDQTVTAGIVSAVDRPVEGEAGAVNMTQTDAPINPGNSGGALANLSGEYVAMPSAIYSQDGENNGIGFAIPIATAKRIADQIVSGQAVATAGLNIEAGDSNREAGAVVSRVTSGGAADDAGLEAGDRITAIDGDQVRNRAELQARIGTYSPGDTVAVTYVRDGQTHTVEVALGTR